MAKTVCKYSRAEIAANRAEIESLVTDATFLCASCGRVSNDKVRLCKATALPVQWALAADHVDVSGVQLQEKVGEMTKKELKIALKGLKKNKKKMKKRLKRAA
jgi:hypothetical protein